MPNTNAESFEELRGKKLKVWSAATSRVLVVQDGNAADADATLQIDEGFRDGYGYGVTGGDGADRAVFTVVSLRASRDGREFVFSLQDFTNANTFGLGPGDVVEFSCELGSTISPGGGSFPAWHAALLAEGSAHVIFRGFIDELQRADGTNGSKEFIVRCVDALQWADRQKVFQSVAEGVNIPWCVFNVDDAGDPDRIIAIKRQDASGATFGETFRQGNAKDPAAEKMTVGEILDYFQKSYASLLVDRGILADPADDLFDAAELATFTMTPPKTVFENAGLGSAVRQLIRANIPDHEVTVDPRTRVWHIRPVHADIASGGFAVATGVVTSKRRWSFADTSLFATSGTGSSVRIVHPTDAYKTEVATVDLVNSTDVRISADTSYDYPVGSFFVPMFASSYRPPHVSIDLENDTEGDDLVVNLAGVYSAVNIVGRSQKRERLKVANYVPVGMPAAQIQARLNKAYDTTQEDAVNYFQHRNRRIDRGREGTPGIYVDEFQTIGSGPTAFTRIYFSEADSAFENDHSVPGGVGTQAEWVGAAVNFRTYDGADSETANISAIVTFFNRAGWMDGPTNSLRRFRIDLDRDLLATAVGLKDRVNDGAPDAFELTHSEIYKPANANRRWGVGRYWQVESTTPADEGRLVDTLCPGLVEYPSVFTPNVTVQHTALPAERTTDAPRTFQELVDYFHLTPTTGAPRVWVIEPPEPPRDYFAEFCAQHAADNPPPRDFTLEVDKITQTVRSVRVPSSGYSGLAFFYYGHAEELWLLTDAFEDESQNEQFQTIADAVFRRVSQPHYTGSVPLLGIVPWIRLIDLGFRVSFGSGPTGFNGGVVNDQRRFWSLAQSVEVDFVASRVSLSFDSRGFTDTFQQDLFERQFVSQTAEMKAVKEAAKNTERMQRCLAMRPPPEPPRIKTGCEVAHGTQSVSRKVTTIDPKNQTIGNGETAIGSPGQGSAHAGSVSGTLAFHPTYIVERNLRTGSAFGIHVPTGALVGGSLDGSGKVFTPNPATTPTRQTTVRTLQDFADEISAAFLGLNLATPEEGQTIATDDGATTTTIPLRFAIHNDGRYVGGWIELRPDTSGQARPRYAIASHTATTITLVSAMSETPPLSGVSGTIYPATVPIPGPAFASGAFPFKDASGNWFVASGGSVTKCTESGGVLTATSGSLATNVGFSGATHSLRGTWDFSSATVSGIPGVGVLTTRGDLLTRDASAYKRLARGAANEVLASDGTDLVWKKVNNVLDFKTGGGVELDGSNLIQLKTRARTATMGELVSGVSGVYIDIATTSLAGAMSAADKTKLDGVASSADVTSSALLAALEANGLDAKGELLSHDGTDPVILAPGSNGLPLVAKSSASAGLAYEAVARVGIADAARADHYFTLYAQRSGVWTAGQQIRLLMNSTDNACRVPIPSGKTLEVLDVYAVMYPGATAGTYKFRIGVRSFNDWSNTTSEADYYANAATEWQTTTVSKRLPFQKSWDGTTPLISIAGGSTRSIMPFLEADSGNPADTTTGLMNCLLVCRFV